MTWLGRVTFSATGLPDGTVYPILRRLERRGVLSAAWEDEAKAHREQRPARRYYRLTKIGEATASEALARFPVLERIFAGGAAGSDPTLA